MPEQNSITIGSKVRIKLNEDIKIVQIVGSAEVDAKKGKISYLSPLGEALLGKSIGEELLISLGNGKTLAVKILDIFWYMGIIDKNKMALYIMIK